MHTCKYLHRWLVVVVVILSSCLLGGPVDGRPDEGMGPEVVASAQMAVEEPRPPPPPAAEEQSVNEAEVKEETQFNKERSGKVTPQVPPNADNQLSTLFSVFNECDSVRTVNIQNDINGLEACNKSLSYLQSTESLGGDDQLCFLTYVNLARACQAAVTVSRLNISEVLSKSLDDLCAGLPISLSDVAASTKNCDDEATDEVFTKEVCQKGDSITKLFSSDRCISSCNASRSSEQLCRRLYLTSAMLQVPTTKQEQGQVESPDTANNKPDDVKEVVHDEVQNENAASHKDPDGEAARANPTNVTTPSRGRAAATTSAKPKDSAMNSATSSQRIADDSKVNEEDAAVAQGDKAGNPGPAAVDGSVHRYEGNMLEMDESLQQQSSLLSYFVLLVILGIVFYLVFHNKHKIVALLLEGRRKKSGRRRSHGSSAQYRKLDNSLEEEMGGADSGDSIRHAIY